MFCMQCGTDTGASPFCSACGASTRQPSGAAQYAEPAAPTPSPSSRTPLVVAAATVALVVVILLAVIFLNTRNEPDSAAGVVPIAVDTSTSSSATGAPKTATAPAKPAKNEPHLHDDGPGNVKDLKSGLFCRDLNVKGYSYAAAVDYWRMHGQSDQMDIDYNAIPCETVYSATDCRAIGAAAPTPAAMGSAAT